VAVVSKKLKNSRAVLYATTANKGVSEDSESFIVKRIDAANRLYGVFFRGNNKTVPLPNGIENKFTQLLNYMEYEHRGKILAAYRTGDASQINQCVDDQIAWLKKIQIIKRVKWKSKAEKYYVDDKDSIKRIDFKTQKDISEDVLDDAIKRMRKSLKRGSNRWIVKRLIRALAQGDETVYITVLEDAAFPKFVDAVNKDYYKTNLLRSLARHDVKVQVHSDYILDLASVDNAKANKKALTQILEKYASSEKAATETLLEMKRIFFAYFFSFDDEKYGKFFASENLWKVPSETIQEDVGGYFDEGFIPLDGYADKFDYTIEDLTREKPLNIGKLKARVRFVNFGKYLQMMSQDNYNGDEIAQYWINYAKEYVEENYQAKDYKNRKVDIDSYKRIRMFKACWKDAVRFICGKYIDLGKAVYHFAMPKKLSEKLESGNEYGRIREEYRNGISSFAYEAIKAEETLQRNIANATVAALSAFSRSVLDYSKQSEAGKEDILFMSKDQLKNLRKEDVLKPILRYYGGQSEVKAFDLNGIALMEEIMGHFSLIRNENFHYAPGKLGEIKYENSLKLWQNDVDVYAQVVRQKYYSNNTAVFYGKENITKLFTALHGKKRVSASQIPAFRSIWRRQEISAFVKVIEKKAAKAKHECSFLNNEEERIKYEGALYFLLKEIYYNDFIFLDYKARDYFVKAVNDYTGTDGIAQSTQAANNFKEYVGNLAGLNLTFAQICQKIQQEYNQQNTNAKKSGKTEESYAHFKMLLPMCVKSAFQQYLADNYKFLFKPEFNEALEDEQDYLDEVLVDCGVAIKGIPDNDKEKRRLAWFTFAHFVHPKQLNLLIGDFKSYIQYRNDVFKRAGFADEYGSAEEKDRAEKEKDVSIKRAKSILDVLEFVRPIAGRVSNVFDDYYDNEDEYARYLSNYITFSSKNEEPTFKNLKLFCENTLADGAMVDIYADKANPKVLRNVEIARMYAGGDVILNGIEKVDAKKVRKYYENKAAALELQKKGLCANEEEQRKIIKQQQLKGQLMLNDVTETFSLVNDMLGGLVSLSYLRERDKMYLLLGYYYMALRNVSNWSNEKLDSVVEDDINIKSGFVLYQVVSMFDYGTSFLYFDSEKNKWLEMVNASINLKGRKFGEMHAASRACAIQLFEMDEQAKDKKQKKPDTQDKKDKEMSVRELRNYVDHFKYYVKFDKSIVELYAEFYTKFFVYSTKLRKSVIVNFSNILERYFLENSNSFTVLEDNKTEINLLSTLKSQQFTYKLNAKDNKGKQLTCNLNAKSANFVKSVKEVLKYKKC